MDSFEKKITVRWSDLDPNGHARHSVYYDYAAQNRIEFLLIHGMTTKYMHEHNFGPILFREEAKFRRELRSGDDLRIDLHTTKLNKNASRWTIRHQIFRGEELCATIEVDGAWIDINKRKLVVPPPLAFETFNDMPKAEDFDWVD